MGWTEMRVYGFESGAWDRSVIRALRDLLLIVFNYGYTRVGSVVY
jgi:hypothetical protein